MALVIRRFGLLLARPNQAVAALAASVRDQVGTVKSGGDASLRRCKPWSEVTQEMRNPAGSRLPRVQIGGYPAARPANHGEAVGLTVPDETVRVNNCDTANPDR